MSCCVVAVSLCFSSCVLAIATVSSIGTLTYRFCMSRVRSLCVGFMVRFVRSLARAWEFLVLYW
jgi:hypothetical protein